MPISAETTDICIFKDGIWHSAILPVAGYQLTRDIAIGLGLPFEVAEEMKRRYGSVMRYTRARSIQQPDIRRRSRVSYNDLCDIIRARVEEILKLISLKCLVRIMSR